MEVGTLVAFEVVESRNTDDIVSIQATMLDEERYGVVGKAEMPLAERHKVIAQKAEMGATPGAKKRPLEDEGEATPTPKSNKKAKNGNGEEADGASAEKKKKEKKDKKDKKEKKEKKEKKSAKKKSK